MFSVSSPCLLGLHCSCSTAHQPVELSENMLQNLLYKFPPQGVDLDIGSGELCVCKLNVCTYIGLNEAIHIQIITKPPPSRSNINYAVYKSKLVLPISIHPPTSKKTFGLKKLPSYFLFCASSKAKINVVQLGAKRGW